MKMIVSYLTLFWWLLPIVLGILWIRRWLFTPWATYVSHIETKAGGVFMVVKLVHWWPPFLSFERTYQHPIGNGRWNQEGSGEEPWGAGDLVDRQAMLGAILRIARARKAETEELAQ